MLGHVLYKGEEAALGVVPRIRTQLLVVRLQALDHAGDAELVVSLGTVQGPGWNINQPIDVSVTLVIMLQKAIMKLLDYATNN